MSNSQILIRELESLPLLNGRYEHLKCINFDASTGDRRGCFSLVFRAHDRIEGRPVAIKFYDIAPNNLAQTYRKEAFRREHDILQVLLNQERCLQLASSLSTFVLNVNVSGDGLEIPCEYFVVEWLDQELDDFFLNQQALDVVDKLHLFNEIVLAIESLHHCSVFHRDLKHDNLRGYEKALKRVIVAIDLGTAALYSSHGILPDYGAPVGAQAYAPPEAFCHFAGDREIAPYADIYALGCLLYELFNADYFYRELRRVNPRFDLYIAAMQSITLNAATPQERVELWKKHVQKYSKGLQPVKISGAGNSVPPGVADILDRVLSQLTEPDFRLRPIKLEGIRRLIWSAIRCIENDKEYKRRLITMRERKRKRSEKIKKREDRLIAFLNKGIVHVSKSITST